MGRSESSYLNYAAPPGDAGFAFSLLTGGKSFFFAAALRACRRSRSRLVTGSRLGTVPVGDPAARTVKAGSPAAATSSSSFPISCLERHLPLDRPRGGGQPPAAGAATAAKLRHQPPWLRQKHHRCPTPLLPRPPGGGSPSAFSLFTIGGF